MNDPIACCYGEAVWTSTGAVCISTRFLILVALVKSSQVWLKSSFLSIKTPAAWLRSILPALHVLSRSTFSLWVAHWCSVQVTQPPPYTRCLNLSGWLLPVSRIPLLLGCRCDLNREGVSFLRYCFAAQLKVVECNSFRNVHLWVYNKRVSVCVFSPLTSRSKVL